MFMSDTTFCSTSLWSIYRTVLFPSFVLVLFFYPGLRGLFID